MISLGMQGEEHHCREDQGIECMIFWEIPALNRNNQQIEMRVLLKYTVATDAHDWAPSDRR
jgi:hypothetical protein